MTAGRKAARLFEDYDERSLDLCRVSEPFAAILSEKAAIRTVCLLWDSDGFGDSGREASIIGVIGEKSSLFIAMLTAASGAPARRGLFVL